MTLTSGPTKSKSSFSAFNEVDEQVAKPILGSDGAARWQDFKQGAGKKTPAASAAVSSVAPALPLKRIDRVALGIQSINDEREIEARVRKEAGDREVGAGYTTFKRKQDHEEIAAAKRKKLILERVRPDDVPYFLKAETFEGYKFDYVFTTRDRGTGYYWDGMDSMRKELGIEPTYAKEMETKIDGDVNETSKSNMKSKKKKRKKSEHVVAVIESDPNNPMEQVAQAILRRKQALDAPPTALLGVSQTAVDAVALGAGAGAVQLASTSANKALEPELVAAGWEAALDPKSGKIYYFRRSTNEQSWEKPKITKPQPAMEQSNLPDGWKSATDPNSGRLYFYDTSGNTSWEKPVG